MDEFNGFEDFISSFHIYRGRAKSRDEEQDTIVGEFKVGEVLCFKLTIVFRLDFQPFWECGCLSSSHHKERGGEIRDTRDTTKRKERDMNYLISVPSHVPSLLNEWYLSLEPVRIVCRRISGNEAYYNSLICRLCISREHSECTRCQRTRGRGHYPRLFLPISHHANRWNVLSVSMSSRYEKQSLKTSCRGLKDVLVK